MAPSVRRASKSTPLTQREFERGSGCDEIEQDAHTVNDFVSKGARALKTTKVVSSKIATSVQESVTLAEELRQR